MNKKGFAVSGILYTILLIFLAIIYMLLMNFKNKKNLLDQLKSEVLLSDKLCEQKIGQVFTFDYTGDVQEFIAECDGNYKLEVWGAQGGGDSTYIGGYGGYSSGIKNLARNSSLYIAVGQKGSWTTTRYVDLPRTYNGGGAAVGTFTSNTDSLEYRGSGGGATHIAIDTNLGELRNYSSNEDKVLITAGGGGSAGYFYYVPTENTVANNGGSAKADATTTTSFGYGEDGIIGSGSGYYGGGASAYTSEGGSNYIGGVTSGTSIAGNNTMPTHDGESTMTGNTGNGYAKITYLGEEQVCDVEPGTTFTYGYTGETQQFTTPCKGYYRIELWGAQGGKYNDTILGAFGGYTSGDILLSKDDPLYVYVGTSVAYSAETKNSTVFNNGLSSSGGWNGGGSTDVRLVSGAWDSFASLKSRIMVAGGGGITSAAAVIPGAGGGLAGYDSSNTTGTLGGTQTSFGTSTYSPASAFGIANGGCTGGNGYYPGAGASCAYGSGGGSSFISGHNGCNAIAESSTESAVVHTGQSVHYSGYEFTNTKMIDGEGFIWTTTKGGNVGQPQPNGTIAVGHAGSGYAKITYLGEQKAKTCNINSGKSYTFSYIGNSQTFKAPCTGSYQVELWGAQGYKTYAGPGGKGAYTSGRINLEANDNLYVYVGNQGNAILNAWNGGGVCHKNSGTNCGASGGGATDIRITSGNWNDAASLRSRIMVAGGGGGAGGHEFDSRYDQYYTIPGDAGGLVGYASSDGATYKPSTGGSQTAGGYNTYPTTTNITDTYGSFGQAPQVDDNLCCGAGGGSGYYGGGGGCGSSGGGGSSFISGYAGSNAISASSTDTNIVHTNQPNHYSGKVFSNGIMIDGKGCNWATGSAAQCGANQIQPNGKKATGHSGNGYARITFIGND